MFARLRRGPDGRDVTSEVSAERGVTAIENNTLCAFFLVKFWRETDRRSTRQHTIVFRTVVADLPLTVRGVLDFAEAHEPPELNGSFSKSKKSRIKTSKVYFV